MHIVPIRCKRWTCRYCARINLKSLIARIKRGKPTKLITLTCKPNDGETPADVYERHRPAIRRLIQWIRRKHGKFEGCVICERHKSGFPHWHIVARCAFIPQAALSRKWLDLTGSQVIDIRRIHNDRHAACYVAKYVTKSTGFNKPAWLTRVCQFTRHYAPRRVWLAPEQFYYERSKLTPPEVIDNARANGYEVEVLRTGWLATRVDRPLPESVNNQFERPPPLADAYS